jgi:hypothetical protein
MKAASRGSLIGGNTDGRCRPVLENDLRREKERLFRFLERGLERTGYSVVQSDGQRTGLVNADALISRIASSSEQWIEIGKGAEDGAAAAKFAGQGYLVVALLKAQDHQPKKGKDGLLHPYTHGHIAIVLRGPTNKDGYPYVICGSNNPDTTHEYGRSNGNRAVNEYVWRQVDAPNVKYYRFVTKFPKLITN